MMYLVMDNLFPFELCHEDLRNVLSGSKAFVNKMYVIVVPTFQIAIVEVIFHFCMCFLNGSHGSLTVLSRIFPNYRIQVSLYTIR